MYHCCFIGVSIHLDEKKRKKISAFCIELTLILFSGSHWVFQYPPIDFLLILWRNSLLGLRNTLIKSRSYFHKQASIGGRRKKKGFRETFAGLRGFSSFPEKDNSETRKRESGKVAGRELKNKKWFKIRIFFSPSGWEMWSNLRVFQNAMWYRRNKRNAF